MRRHGQQATATGFPVSPVCHVLMLTIIQLAFGLKQQSGWTLNVILHVFMSVMLQLLGHTFDSFETNNDHMMDFVHESILKHQ